MCPGDTFRRTGRGLLAFAAAGIAVVSANGQTSAGWRQVGGTSINEGLASPAGGQVVAVWYSGATLLAKTVSGRIFETADFIHWRLNTTNTAAVPATSISLNSGREYSLRADNLYGSEDSGRTWVNLTASGGLSILGAGFTAIASPAATPSEVTAANREGVWRSLDGGVSWRGLNEDLPALPVRKLIGRGLAELNDGSFIQLAAGEWTLAKSQDADSVLQSRFGASAHVDVTAAAQGSGIGYAGTADGRLLSSRDNGNTWLAAPAIPGIGRISRIWIDSTRPDAALAAAGSHLLRTVNGGLFWDDVSGGLADTEIHGIAADRSAGVVYLATDRGVFSGAMSLNDAGPVNPEWKAISADLPAAPAWDVRLDVDNTLTVALDGYGVFEKPAPHRTRAVRIVNGADMSERAAAPGSVITVVGAEVRSVTTGNGAWPVLAVSDSSSQLQVPFEAGAGTLSLSIETASDRWSAPLVVKDASPAIFVDSDGAPLILDASSGLVLDSKTPVYAGSTVQLLATGLGKVSPDWPTGVPAPLENPPVAVSPIGAFLDGSPVEVTRATLAPGYVGYYVVELRIPSIVNRGAGELRIVMNGEESNRVKLYLEPDSPK